LLDVVDRVGRLDFEGDRLAGESLDKDLHGSECVRCQMKWIRSEEFKVGRWADGRIYVRG
jgi:hypothetical protein